MDWATGVRVLAEAVMCLLLLATTSRPSLNPTETNV